MWQILTNIVVTLIFSVITYQYLRKGLLGRFRKTSFWVVVLAGVSFSLGMVMNVNTHIMLLILLFHAISDLATMKVFCIWTYLGIAIEIMGLIIGHVNAIVPLILVLSFIVVSVAGLKAFCAADGEVLFMLSLYSAVEDLETIYYFAWLILIMGLSFTFRAVTKGMNNKRKVSELLNYRQALMPDILVSFLVIFFWKFLNIDRFIWR